jgi:hypothetical protein
MEPNEFMFKWFKPIYSLDQIQGTCVSYRNEKVAKVIDSYLHNKSKPLNAWNGYYTGMRLMCRSPLRLKTGRMTRNFVYNVTVVGDVFELKDHHDITWTVNFDLIVKHFTFCYAYSGHSLQGTTVGGALTIFDFDYYMADPEWLWTCVTRPRDLDRVYFYAGNLSLTLKKCQTYNIAVNRIRGHKDADRIAGRDFAESDYITAEDAMALFKIGGRCGGCGECLGDDWSIDRIDNDLPHLKGNCRLRCLSCQHAKN